MTPQLLDRATHAFRIGYQHGRDGKPFTCEAVRGTFYHRDYSDGYAAGRNEVHWNAVKSGRACDIRTRRCGFEYIS